MSYAFISYKTDDLHEALWVKEKLGEKGVPCWMAPDSIPGGSSYAQEIPKAIRNCFAFILILSEKTQDSKFVPKEIDLAINLGKPILPFMLENFELRDDFNFYLSNVNRFPAYQSRERCLDLIATRIDEILNGVHETQTIDEVRKQIRAAKEKTNDEVTYTAPEPVQKQVEYVPPQPDYYPPAEYYPSADYSNGYYDNGYQQPAYNSQQGYYDNGYQQPAYNNQQGYYDNSYQQPVYTQPAYTGTVQKPAENISNRHFVVCLILAIFFGYWGLHRFYAGKIGTGILWMFSFGGFGIGWFVDVITILSGSFTDSAKRPIKPNKK